MSQVLQFRRPDKSVELWMSEKAFREELGTHLGGHVPSRGWLYTRRREGMPSAVKVHRLLVPRDRALRWLKDGGWIP